MPKELKAIEDQIRRLPYDDYAPKPQVDMAALDDAVRRTNEPIDVLAEITSEIGYIPMMDYCKAILATEGWGEGKPEIHQLAAILCAWSLKHRSGK